MAALFLPCVLLAGTASAADGWVYSQQLLFATNSGGGPQSIVEGRDGWLYGTTSSWGNSDRGTIFKIRRDGTGLIVLRHLPTNGVERPGHLMEASDGILYGTSQYGGTNGLGAVFRLNRDGADYSIVHHFRSVGSEGYYPMAPLAEAADGALYGTTRSGGTGGWLGTVFKVNKDGRGFTILHHFGSVPGDGANPDSVLVAGSDGLIYGITPYAGTNGAGTVFRMDPGGSGYTLLHHFSKTAGSARYPDALIEGSDGVLYGSGGEGGTSNCGTVFRLGRDGSDFRVLMNFTNCMPGNYPIAKVSEGKDGLLYGTTGQCGTGYGTVFALAKDGSFYSELWRFRILAGDGQWPITAPIWASDGSLYGVTQYPQRGALYRMGAPQSRVWCQQTAEGFALRLGGVPGRNYELQRSTDFLNWTSITNFTATLFPFVECVDTNNTESGAFYRSAVAP